MCESESEMKRPLPEDGTFRSVTRVLHRKWQRLLGSVRAVASDCPVQVGYFRNAEFERRLSELAPAHDAVFAHLIRTASYLDVCRSPKLLEMTDAISLSYSRTAQKRGYLLGAAYNAESRRLFSYERALINQCDLTILVSEVDRDYLVSDAPSRQKVMVCCNGVDLDKFPFNYSPDGRTIIFIGKNFAFYNVDAILNFVERILPLVRLRFPETKFKVIGQIGSSLKRRLQKQEVIVTGGVDDIAQVARNASIGVCPLRVGAGVQNKILEYMALGIPTVTSGIGAEGLAAQPGHHLLVANEPEQWSEQICRLFSNPAIGHELAHRGREYVEKNHSWSALVEPLKEGVLELLQKQKEGRLRY